MMNITRKSSITGITRTRVLPVTEEQIKAWESGDLLIQHAFTNLNDSDKEFILTGIVDEEWDSIL